MADEIATLVTRLTADESAFKSGLQRAQDELKRFEKQTKSVLGKQSALGQGFGLLKGGAAVAGLAVASNVVASFTQKVSALTRELDRGRIGAADFARGLVDSIPVISGVANAVEGLITLGVNLVGLKTGKQIADEFYEAKRSFDAATKSASSLADQLAVVNATPFERETLEIEIKRRNELARVRADLQKAASLADEEGRAKVIAKLQEEYRLVNQIADVQLNQIARQRELNAAYEETVAIGEELRRQRENLDREDRAAHDEELEQLRREDEERRRILERDAEAEEERIRQRDELMREWREEEMRQQRANEDEWQDLLKQITRPLETRRPSRMDINNILGGTVAVKPGDVQQKALAVEQKQLAVLEQINAKVGGPNEAVLA